MGGGRERRETQRMQQNVAQRQLDQSDEFLNLYKEEFLPIAKAGEARRGQLFEMGLPGYQQVMDKYTNIMRGDTQELQRQIAPGTEFLTRATESVKNQIRSNMPRGGAMDLALAQADVSKAGQIGTTATTAYNQAPLVLAQLAGQVMGLSQNEMAQILSALGGGGAALGGGSQAMAGAATTFADIGQQQAQAHQAMMGFFGQLAGSAGAAAGGFGAGKAGQ